MGDEVCWGGGVFVEGDEGRVTQISLIDADFANTNIQMIAIN